MWCLQPGNAVRDYCVAYNCEQQKYPKESKACMDIYCINSGHKNEEKCNSWACDKGDYDRCGYTLPQCASGQMCKVDDLINMSGTKIRCYDAGTYLEMQGDVEDGRMTPWQEYVGTASFKTGLGGSKFVIRKHSDSYQLAVDGDPNLLNHTLMYTSIAAVFAHDPRYQNNVTFTNISNKVFEIKSNGKYLTLEATGAFAWKSKETTTNNQLFVIEADPNAILLPDYNPLVIDDLKGKVYLDYIIALCSVHKIVSTSDSYRLDENNGTEFTLNVSKSTINGWQETTITVREDDVQPQGNINYYSFDYAVDGAPAKRTSFEDAAVMYVQPSAKEPTFRLCQEVGDEALYLTYASTKSSCQATYPLNWSSDSSRSGWITISE
jgi:hypothetical protein